MHTDIGNKKRTIYDPIKTIKHKLHIMIQRMYKKRRFKLVGTCEGGEYNEWFLSF